MTTVTDFQSLKGELANLWATCVIAPEKKAKLRARAHQLLNGLDIYKEIQRLTGVPIVVIAAIHEREGAGSFTTYLGNGQALNRRTTIVPIGRGPFNSFVDGAVDALVLEGYTTLAPWTIEKALWAFEKFNGFGYRFKHLNSPYVWGATNHQQVGKYVADNVFDPNVWDTQIGAAAMMKALVEEDPSLAIGASVAPKPIPVGPTVPPAPKPQPAPLPGPGNDYGTNIWDALVAIFRSIVAYFGGKK